MTDLAMPDAYAVITEPATLTMKRLLPGPIERVWTYLSDSDFRRQWLAAGDMQTKAGAPFTLTWRNDELTNPPGDRPEAFAGEHSMDSKITQCREPYLLGFTWGNTGEISIQLEPRGDDVLLTLVHKRLPGHPDRINIAAGWHAHLDLLVNRVSGQTPGPFWDGFLALRAQYVQRLPA
ncbi:SRPBCC family protein [Devosia sp.]|uniref:SRPBCC family protein n=1 Tax=Devosia sp. TaxID=1871048 RepID=UPI0032651515